jgi:hypothetical protein
VDGNVASSLRTARFLVVRVDGLDDWLERFEKRPVSYHSDSEL